MGRRKPAGGMSQFYPNGGCEEMVVGNGEALLGAEYIV
jgi:hypothetical protein